MHRPDSIFKIILFYVCVFIYSQDFIQAAVYNHRSSDCICTCPKEKNPICGTIGGSKTLMDFDGQCQFQCFARCNEDSVRFIYCGKCNKTREFAKINAPVTEDRFSCLEFEIKKAGDRPAIPIPGQENPGSGQPTPTGPPPVNPAPGPAPGTDPGTPPGTAPGSPPGPAPGTPPGTPPGSPPGPAPGTPPGSPPGTAPGSPPGTAPGTPPGPETAPVTPKPPPGEELPPCTTEKASGRFAQNKKPPGHEPRKHHKDTHQSDRSFKKSAPAPPSQLLLKTYGGRNIQEYKEPQPPSKPTKKPEAPPPRVANYDLDGQLVVGDYYDNAIPSREARAIPGKESKYQFKNPKFHLLLPENDKYQYPHGISFQ